MPELLLDMTWRLSGFVEGDTDNPEPYAEG